MVLALLMHNLYRKARILVCVQTLNLVMYLCHLSVQHCSHLNLQHVTTVKLYSFTTSYCYCCAIRDVNQDAKKYLLASVSLFLPTETCAIVGGILLESQAVYKMLFTYIQTWLYGSSEFGYFCSISLEMQAFFYVLCQSKASLETFPLVNITMASPVDDIFQCSRQTSWILCCCTFSAKKVVREHVSDNSSHVLEYSQLRKKNAKQYESLPNNIVLRHEINSVEWCFTCSVGCHIVHS